MMEGGRPDREPRGQRPSLPLDRDLPDGDPLLYRDPLDGDPPDREPPPVNRITDRCKNIAFPQLRFER